MKTTRKDYRVGHRVEIPPHFDAWMRGARYGVVASVSLAIDNPLSLTTLCNVRMDNPRIRRLVRVEAGDLRFIEPKFQGNNSASDASIVAEGADVSDDIDAGRF